MGVGVATALAALRPTGGLAVAAVVAGAAVGSVICDVDVKSGRRERDAFMWRMLALALCGMLLLYDYVMQGPVCAYIMGSFGIQVIMGAVGFGAVIACAATTRHRTFAHSLVAMALWCASLSLLCPVLVAPFALGLASHVLLDLTNKRGVQLFWPLRAKVSLGLFKADGWVDGLLAAAGAMASVLFLLASV